MNAKLFAIPLLLGMALFVGCGGASGPVEPPEVAAPPPAEPPAALEPVGGLPTNQQ